MEPRTPQKTPRSPKFNELQKLYHATYWFKNRIRDAVAKGWITAEEYRLITKEDFSEQVK